MSTLNYNCTFPEQQNFYRNTTPLTSSLTFQDNYDNSSTISGYPLISELISKTLLNSNVDSGLLPPGVRHISPGIVIFERPPSMQLIQYINNSVDEISAEGEEYYDDENDEYKCTELESVSSYYIPVPWQLYVASYSTSPGSEYFLTSVKMFFMNGPYNHSGINLYSPYIPNFYGNGTLCNPMLDSFDDLNRYQKNIAGVIESSYDWIWNTGFNADLYECISQTCYQKPNDFIAQNFPKKNVNFYSNRVVDNFYTAISELSLDDVTNMKWANPSYRPHYQSDRSLISSGLYDSGYPIYLEQNGLTSDLDFEENKNEFYTWLPENLHMITKTYQEVISYIFENEYHFQSAKNPDTFLKDVVSFVNKIHTTHNTLKEYSSSYT